MRSAEPPRGRQAIIATALEIFAESGIEATSLRAVARRAGVSPALVVHHFGGKEGLVAAVDEAAVDEFAAAYRADAEDEGVDLLRRRAEQTARVMAAAPSACAYLGRALVEGTEGSARLFALMVEGGREEVDSLADAGALRPDADRVWATLQHFFLIWAPLSFAPLLRGTIGGELLSPPQLRRWVDANVDLLQRGLYR